MVKAMAELKGRQTNLLAELERQIGDPLKLEVILDMAETPIISSQFVNELIRTNLRLRMTERRLLLINVQPTVIELLKLLRLDRTFDCEPVPNCIENEQTSAVIKQRFDATEKTSFFLLRKFASRFAPAR
jgi:anti-anti-sigma regulatory factor